jgi:uncharacterized protein (TIGR00661 family)
MISKKNILITPLDWGLGHATRCIPIINALKTDYNIIIATSGGAALLLKNEFPALKHVPLPSYNITYPVKKSLSLHMLTQMPGIISAIIQEHKAVKAAIKKYSIDLIISDNRFGTYSKNIPSVFITHQVNIKSPSLNKLINKLNHRFIHKFSSCWIPDFESAPGLAGELSHPSAILKNYQYVGPFSRSPTEKFEKEFDITVILSGPEPQRTLFEDILFKQLLEMGDLKINVVRGIYTEKENGQAKHIKVYDHLSVLELEKMLHESKHVICRAGYSSIMDLQNFDAKAMLVPTPQQTEQEYLAKMHCQNGEFYVQQQNEINVSDFLNSPEQKRKISKENKTDFSFQANKLITEYPLY